MSRSSECPRCGTGKPSHMFACKPCWFDLPKPIRDAIWDAYRHHGVLSEEYTDAALDAHRHWGIA